MQLISYNSRNIMIKLHSGNVITITDDCFEDTEKLTIDIEKLNYLVKHDVFDKDSKKFHVSNKTLYEHK